MAGLFWLFSWWFFIISFWALLNIFLKRVCLYLCNGKLNHLSSSAIQVAYLRNKHTTISHKLTWCFLLKFYWAPGEITTDTFSSCSNLTEFSINSFHIKPYLIKIRPEQYRSRAVKCSTVWTTKHDLIIFATALNQGFQAVSIFSGTQNVHWNSWIIVSPFSWVPSIDFYGWIASLLAYWKI